MNKEKAICIIGGVGPMAGVGLHSEIIQQTKTDGTDQTHLAVIHLSFSESIEDRTEYLLSNKGENPAHGALRVAQGAYLAARELGKDVVIGVPCNTFHAPQIFDKFLSLLKQDNISVDVVHMLAETANYIAAALPKVKNIGLMSTTGTRQVGVYRNIFEPRGINIIEVDEKEQSNLHETIYDKTKGIKAVSPVTSWAVDNFRKFANQLINNGAEAIILGCTEIPLALSEKTFNNVPLIDPVYVLARSLIKAAAPEKLKP